MKWSTATALACAALALTLTGCSDQQSQGKGDAPVDRSKVDDSAPEVINFPDSFGNVAHKCDGHGHRVFTNTHTNDASTLVVIEDPTCPGGKAG